MNRRIFFVPVMVAIIVFASLLLLLALTRYWSLNDDDRQQKDGYTRNTFVVELPTANYNPEELIEKGCQVVVYPEKVQDLGNNLYGVTEEVIRNVEVNGTKYSIIFHANREGIFVANSEIFPSQEIALEAVAEASKPFGIDVAYADVQMLSEEERNPLSATHRAVVNCYRWWQNAR
ncbi:hypothetical protein KBC79_05140 [Candidatus Woesebacteria bacterium]|nr:hypothetical protein [Candidatus Woesebacteria bacterium]